jgi:conjugative transfer signal peptidase TraF
MRSTSVYYGQWVIFGTAGLVLCLACSLSMMGYRINSTPSLPLGVWKVDSLFGPLCREQIVSIAPPDTVIFQLARARQYLDWGTGAGGYTALLKPVGAIPGDRVAVSADGITVNGVRLPNSKPLATDSAGRSLVPVETGTYTVKQDTVWLMSNSARSFDSRYFGALPTKNILGTAKPIWIGGTSK